MIARVWGFTYVCTLALLPACQGQAPLQSLMSAKSIADEAKLDAANVATFKIHPEEAVLRPEFVSRARTALTAVRDVVGTDTGVAGEAFASRKVDDTIKGLQYDLGEELVWLALGNYMLGRLMLEFGTGTDGAFAPLTSAQAAQEKACEKAISDALSSGVGPPTYRDCALSAFARAVKH